VKRLPPAGGSGHDAMVIAPTLAELLVTDTV